MSDAFQPQRYCRNCGGQIRPDSSFCISCGAPLSRQGLDSAGATGRSIPPSIQRNESSTSGQTRSVSDFSKWFRGLSTASKRGLVALGVLGALVVVSLIVFSSSGDWESDESYVSDIEDSYTSIVSIEDSVADTIYAYRTDSYTLSEDVADQIAMSQGNLDTHIDYFEDSAPPSGYGLFQENTLEAWRTFDGALETLEEGYRYQDQDLLDEGFNQMDDYRDLIRAAEGTLPDTDTADRLRDDLIVDDGGQTL